MVPDRRVHSIGQGGPTAPRRRSTERLSDAVTKPVSKKCAKKKKQMKKAAEGIKTEGASKHM